MNEYMHPYVYLRQRVGSTGVTRFALPLEFVKHAEWLMRGAHRTLDTHRSPRCKCKCCDRDDGSYKSAISSVLKCVGAHIGSD